MGMHAILAITWPNMDILEWNQHYLICTISSICSSIYAKMYDLFPKNL